MGCVREMVRRYPWLWLWLALLLVACGGEARPRQLTSPVPPATATVPLPSATPTPTPTSTPSPTPTPTATPTPTPLPTVRLALGGTAVAVGDWPVAELHFRHVLSEATVAPAPAEEAALALGRVLLADGRPAEAADVLRPIVGAQPDAHLLLADALMQMDDPQAAVPHYRAFLEAAPLLSSYVNQWLGDACYAGGVYTDALTAYEAALSGAEERSRRALLMEKMALAYGMLGDGEAALETYDAILAMARIPAYRARMMYQAAETALLFGMSDEAYRRMQVLVETYPKESVAYQALIKFVEAGVPVDDLLRGKVDYYAGAYGPAVQAFYRVIEADPDHDGEPHYYAGLAYLEAGSYAPALQEFETLLSTHPGDAYWGSAWIGKAQALAALGRVDEAVEAYRTLAARLPDHFRAPEALWKAAALLEDVGRLGEAAEAFEALALRYPDDEGAPKARFRAGLLRYRLASEADEGERAQAMEAARDAWRALAAWYPQGEEAQAAYFWLGKSYLAAGAALSATEALSRAVGLGPWRYYGLRAADLLEGDGRPFATAYAPIRACGSEAERREAEAWLADWLGLEAGAELATMPPSLAGDARLRRGTELLRLGHFDEGRAELERLREATARDALTQYRLALYFRDIGLYRSSIIAASTVWQLSPVYDIRVLPRYLGCLVYPTYYAGLVEAEARRHNFDPLVLYALIRQESLFEGMATSYAAAHGLMQVIPPTGAQIAAALKWPPDYETRDLYRPAVSVRFGVWYLAQQRDALDGSLIAAMAAYNGGPGNASRWWAEAHGDEDLFAELIGLRETYTYVRRIREHYARYRWLYGKGG